jgi:putative PEP-CTERM system TPR-repeat lipoprotein
MPLATAALAAALLAGTMSIHGLASVPANPYLQSARQLERKNDLKGAEIQLRNAAQADPANGAIMLELATVYLRLGDANAAQAELFSAQMHGVKEEQVAPLMAQALLETGQFGDLLRDIPAGNRNPKTESIVRTARGMAQLALGEVADAQTMLSDAERLDPKSIAPKIAIARLYLGQSKIDDATKKIDEALSLQPKNSQALEVKGLALLMGGKPDAAVQQFTAAINANPRDVQPLLDRANVEINTGKVDLADKDIDAALAIAPGGGMAMFLKAQSDARHGNFKDADDILNKLRGVMDRLPNAYLLSAEVKLKLNQPAQAEDELNRLIAKRPNEPKAYQLLGMISFHKGDVDRAISLLEKSLTLAPHDGATMTALAQAYVSHGELDKAQALFAQAAQLQPKNANLQAASAATKFAAGDREASLAELAGLFKGGNGSLAAGPPLVLGTLQTGDIGQADAVASTLVKHDAGNVLYQELLAMVRVAEHNYPAAETLYTNVLAKQPGLLAARRDLAQIYMATNRPAAAKKLFQDALAKNPSDLKSVQALADLDVQTKDYDGAIKLFARAQELSPSDPTPSLHIVSVEEIQRKWPDALARVHGLQTRFANNPAVADAVAQVKFGSGDHAGALSEYERAAAAFPKAAPIWAHYAGALAAQKDYVRAMDAASKAIALDPNDKALKGSFVYLTYLAKGPDAAISQAETFMAPNPAEPGGALLTAQVMVSQGKRPEAISLLEKWQSHSPSGPVALSLAGLFRADNQPAKATAVLEKWTTAHPDDAASSNYLAEIYGATGKPDLALAQYERLAAQRPNDPVVLNNLAWFYDQRHDPRAVTVARKAAAIAPKSGSIADTLGWILMNGGDKAGALKYLGFASASMPTDAAIQYHYAFALSKDGQRDAAKSVLQRVMSLKADPQILSSARILLAAESQGH